MAVVKYDFKQTGFGPQSVERSDGEFVKFTAYEKLEEERDKLKEAMEVILSQAKKSL